MAKGDIKVLRGGGETRSYLVDDRTTSTADVTIKAGEPVVESTNYAAGLRKTAGPVIATDVFIGIANSESTETSALNGTVEVITLLESTVLRGKASTAANVDTAAELLAYLNNNVYFDYSGLTTSLYTIDENDTDDPNLAALRIIAGSGDAAATLDVIVHMNATEHAPLVGQTMD